MTEFFEGKRNDYLFYIIVFIAMLLCFFPLGLKYFLYMDDFNQYGSYYLFSQSIWKDVILQYKLYALRPLAGLLDGYLISRLWNQMWLVLFLMSLTQLINIILIKKIFDKCDIPWGRVGSVIFAFYPMMLEATYWISASSRLVVGMFFSVLAVYLLLCHLEQPPSRRPRRRLSGFLIASLITGIIAQGFYEQIVLFSFVLTGIVLISKRNLVKNRLIYTIPFINISLIGVYYFIFRNVGHLGNRAQSSSGGIFSSVAIGLKRVWSVLWLEQRFIPVNTIKWGVFELASEHTAIFVGLLLLTLIIMLFIYSEITNRDKYRYKSPLRPLIFALILIVAPFGPFLIVDSFPYLRNVYPSVVGLGIVAAMIWEWCATNRYSKAAISVLAGVILVLSLCANTMGVISYEKVARNDELLVSQIADVIQDNPEHDRVWIFGVKYAYERLIAPHYVNSLQFDWSATGRLYVALGEKPVPESGYYVNPVISGLNYEINLNSDFNGAILLGISSDMTVSPLTLDENQLFLPDGSLFGELLIEENGTRLVLSPDV